LSFNSGFLKETKENGKSIEGKLITKKQALERSKCPKGSFVHAIKSAGHKPLMGKIIRGRYTYFYSHDILDVLVEKYGKKKKKRLNK